MSSIHGETVAEIESIAKQKMAKTVEDLRREMASIRTGRASVHVLDSVKADYYGTLTPISQSQARALARAAPTAMTARKRECTGLMPGV